MNSVEVIINQYATDKAMIRYYQKKLRDVKVPIKIKNSMINYGRVKGGKSRREDSKWLAYIDRSDMYKFKIERLQEEIKVPEKTLKVLLLRVPHEFEVLYRRYIEDFSVEEIATETGMEVKLVRARLKVARMRFEKIMRQLLPSDVGEYPKKEEEKHKTYDFN